MLSQQGFNPKPDFVEHGVLLASVCPFVIVVSSNGKVEQCGIEILERIQAVVYSDGDVLLLGKRVQPSVKRREAEPMPMVAERIMRRDEIGEIGIETSDGEADTNSVFNLLIEWNFLRFRLSERQLGNQQKITYPDQREAHRQRN